jgi:hypothetical protein
MNSSVNTDDLCRSATQICNAAKAYYIDRNNTPYHGIKHQRITVEASFGIQQFLEQYSKVISKDLNVKGSDLHFLHGILPWIMSFHDAIYSVDIIEMQNNELNSANLFCGYMQEHGNIYTNQEQDLIKSLFLHTKVEFVNGVVINPDYTGNKLFQLGQFLIEYIDKVSLGTNKYLNNTYSNHDLPLEMNLRLQFESYINKTGIKPIIFYTKLLADNDQKLEFAYKAIQSFESFINKSIKGNMLKRFQDSSLNDCYVLAQLFHSGILGYEQSATFLSNHFQRMELNKNELKMNAVITLVDNLLQDLLQNQ